MILNQIKYMKFKIINKILSPFYFYVILYFAINLILHNLIPNALIKYYGFLMLIILPVIVLIKIIKQKNKFLEKQSYLTTFMFCLIPGLFIGFLFSYGFISSFGDSYNYISGSYNIIKFIKEFIKYGFIFLLPIAFLFGIFGVIIEFIIKKIVN